MSMKRKPPTGNARRVISLGNNFHGVTTNKQGHLVQFESEQERKLILYKISTFLSYVRFHSIPELRETRHIYPNPSPLSFNDTHLPCPMTM